MTELATAVCNQLSARVIEGPALGFSVLRRGRLLLKMSSMRLSAGCCEVSFLGGPALPSTVLFLRGMTHSFLVATALLEQQEHLRMLTHLLYSAHETPP